jgi:hypothetical protein
MTLEAKKTASIISQYCTRTKRKLRVKNRKIIFCMQLFSVFTLPSSCIFPLNKIYRLREIFCLSLSIEKKRNKLFCFVWCLDKSDFQEFLKTHRHPKKNFVLYFCINHKKLLHFSSQTMAIKKYWKHINSNQREAILKRLFQLTETFRGVS